ncbi:NUDIX domain-containing protein [Shinella kummerowiae]|jgi:8-oxo-dGTP diphosphatase|uniref:NUDIX domain-containing protein n=1 Tax=Shinella kummerowiae TaxID=417745 RepID=A0A6N8SG13_9HYPH|nr:NUDIX domain-containing protein [Shinella kummerowiae]MXN48004.1 NUDIX domain-containing protein [Shinella kummerowiae]
MQREIRIAVALIVRENGDTLLVRKRGMPMYMQAGGNIAGGEAPKAALARHLHDELGLLVSAARMAPFGCFEAEAADAPDHLLIAYVFLIKLHNEDIAPTAGIDEAVWTPIDKAPALPLAPLTRNHILTLFWQMQFGADLSYQPEKAVLQASHARN